MLTTIQQIGVCLLGWIVSIFVIHAIFTRIERETTRDKDDEEMMTVGLAIVFWFAIFLIMPK